MTCAWTFCAILVVQIVTSTSRAVVDWPIHRQGGDVSLGRHRLIRRAEATVDSKTLLKTSKNTTRHVAGRAIPVHVTVELPGVDFSRGDLAWSERLAEITRRHPTNYSNNHEIDNQDDIALATAAPLTVLYVLAHYKERLFPGPLPTHLRIHVLGASYPFEGQGQWGLLGDAMPPGMQVEVLLVMGAPAEADGVPEVNVTGQRAMSCNLKTPKISVTCIEAYYQEVMYKQDVPHLAVMFNPGFPQLTRRSWDPTLLFLLQKAIPTAVSVQLTNRNRGWPRAGEPWVATFADQSDEDFAVNTTLAVYGANTWGMTGSPFPIVEQDHNTESKGDKIVKNGLIELFQGLSPGKELPSSPAAMSRQRLQFLKDVGDKEFALWEADRGKTTYDDDEVLRDLLGGLAMPTSDAFERAGDAVYLKDMERHVLSKRFQNLTAQVSQRTLRIMDRMKRMESLSAGEWLFLAKHFDLEPI